MSPRFAVIAPDLSRGVRAAIAVVIPFYLAAQLDHPELAWLALGGWLGALADPAGTRRARATAMAVFTVASFAVIWLGGVLAVQPVVAAAFIAVVGFAASLARAINGPAGTIGNLIVLVTAIASARPPGSAFSEAWLFAAGALWAVALSSIVWPGWPHLPLRVALGKVFAELAAYCDAIAVAGGDPRADWAALARDHQRRVRTELEHARGTMVALRARHAGERPVGTNLRVLLGDAELLFFRVIALADEAEAGGGDARAVARELAALDREIAERLVTRTPGTPAPSTPIAVTSSLARGAIEWTRKALVRSRDLDVLGANGTPVAHSSTAKVGLAEAARAVRDALTPRSPVFQHALRVALTCASAYGLGRIASPTHSTWVTVTAIVVLQPYLGATLVRLVERVIGTILGGAVAIVMMETIADQRVLALLLVPLAVAAVITRTRSYRLFVLLLTPVFVLVTDRWHPGLYTIGVRIADIALGGALAAVAALIAPSTERARLADALAAMLDALARYADGAFEVLSQGSDRARLTLLRRELGVALETAEVSLERMLAEPKPLRRGTANAAVLITYARRLSATLTALDEAAAGGPRPTIPEAIQAHVQSAIAAAKAHVLTDTTVPRIEPVRADTSTQIDRLAHFAMLIRQTAVAA
ncbi:MAG: FUSC family protein [Deltaproteobacteria bacterium]